MKKFTLFLVLASFAVTGFTQSNIPNGSLENWYNIVVNASLNYDQPGTGPSDNWITTLNELASIPAPIGPGPVSVYKTTDVYAGTYACKLVSQNFVLVPNDVFIPGMLGTAKINMLTSTAVLGRTCPGCKPISFRGWYKYQPVNGDSCVAVILLSKWNSATHKRDTIGYGKMTNKDTVSTYTLFNVTVNYISSLSPDTMTLLVISSGGFNVVNFMGSVGQVGSTMYVDELMLEYPEGIEQALMPEVNVNCYPVPARESLTIELSEPVRGGFMEVYTLHGQMVASYGLSSQKSEVAVGTLSPGTYYYKLKQGSHVLNTGSFVKQR